MVSLWISALYRALCKSIVMEMLTGNLLEREKWMLVASKITSFSDSTINEVSGWLTNLVMMSRVVTWGIWICWGVSPCCSNCFGIKCLWAISIFSSCVYPGKEVILFSNYSHSFHSFLMNQMQIQQSLDLEWIYMLLQLRL